MIDYLERDEFDVYLTHPHPDHTWGLVYVEYTFWKWMAMEARARNGYVEHTPIWRRLNETPPRVRVHAHPDHLEDVQQFVQRFRDEKMLHFVPLPEVEPLPGGATLRRFPVSHREGELCFGFRLDRSGGSLAYVTDTYGEPGVPYQEDIRGVDVLLHECYMEDHESENARAIGHSHITPVARLAAEAEVGRLVLIHLNALRPVTGEPEVERVQAIFPEVEVAYDGMVVEIG
jgi:ribonuclease BN (tRNA processing enzyme)